MKPIYHIKIGKSKNLLKDYTKRFNANKPLKNQIRFNHVHLMSKLYFYYSKHIAKAQCIDDSKSVQKGIELPELRTNRVQLSKALNCSERTIYNLLDRLQEAKIILNKTWHGSNSSFGLKFSAAILHISSTIDDTNQVLYFSDTYQPGASQSSDSAPVFFGDSLKTLPHTVTSTLLELKKYNKEKVANVDKPHSTGKDKNKKMAKPNRDENLQETNTGNTANKTNSQLDATGTPPQVAPIPPNGPETMAEAAQNLSDKNKTRLEKRVKIIWDIAERDFYSRFWLNERETERAKARIAEFLIYGDPQRWDAGVNEIITRLKLVDKWVKKVEKSKKQTWKFPLPSIYFDIRNHKGFISTKAWYKSHIKHRKEVNNQIILTKAVQKYMKSLNDNAIVSPTETYRQISQHLGKKSQYLLTEFNKRVAAYE